MRRRSSAELLSPVHSDMLLRAMMDAAATEKRHKDRRGSERDDAGTSADARVAVGAGADADANTDPGADADAEGERPGRTADGSSSAAAEPEPTPSSGSQHGSARVSPPPDRQDASGGATNPHTADPGGRADASSTTPVDTPRAVDFDPSRIRAESAPQLRKTQSAPVNAHERAEESREKSSKNDETKWSGGVRSSTTGATMFTRTELRCLKVLFTIMDRDDSQQISKEELVAYAEETGDYAQTRELTTIMEAIDGDGDGLIGLLDFVLFAARMKDSHSREQFSGVMTEMLKVRRSSLRPVQAEARGVPRSQSM